MLSGPKPACSFYIAFIKFQDTVCSLQTTVVRYHVWVIAEAPVTCAAIIKETHWACGAHSSIMNETCSRELNNASCHFLLHSDRCFEHEWSGRGGGGGEQLLSNTIIDRAMNPSAPATASVRAQKVRRIHRMPRISAPRTSERLLSGHLGPNHHYHYAFYILHQVCFVLRRSLVNYIPEGRLLSPNQCHVRTWFGLS